MKCMHFVIIIWQTNLRHLNFLNKHHHQQQQLSHRHQAPDNDRRNDETSIWVKQTDYTQFLWTATCLTTDASKVSVCTVHIFSLSTSPVLRTHFLYAHEGRVQQRCDLAPSHAPVNHTFNQVPPSERWEPRCIKATINTSQIIWVKMNNKQ